MALTALNNKLQQLVAFDNGGNGAVASQANVEHGLTFNGNLWDGAQAKAQNNQVFNSLSEEIRNSIQRTIEKQADANWCAPSEIVKGLKSIGVEAVAGKTGEAAYVEITNADGSKSRIWDIGSDGGIGTQDIDFNSKLANAINDIKNYTAPAAKAAEATKIEEITNVIKAPAFDSKLEKSGTDPLSLVMDMVAKRRLQEEEKTQLFNSLVEMLKSQGFSELIAELENEARRLLPFYSSTAA